MSFFPVIRLSGRAIDILKERRIEHGKIYKNFENDPNARWIFCELFVPTELAKKGYSAKLLENQYLRFNPNFNFNKERVFEFPDYKLYHPVR